MEQRLSSKGFRYMRKVEGVKPKMYIDQAGHPTIGIGHKLLPQELKTGLITIKGKTYSWKNGLNDTQIDDLFDQDNDYCEVAIHQNVRSKLNQDQFDALVSFIFNIGVYSFITSTLIKKINSKDLDAVPVQMRRFIKIRDKKTGQLIVSKGLINRRNSDVSLWNGDFK